MSANPTPTPAAGPGWRFDNSYARELGEGFAVPWKPAGAPAPRTLFLNRALAQELGLDPASLEGEAGAALLSGNALPEGAEPVAQAYAGHQFGGFSPKLGDGRALLLGELIDPLGRRRDLAFKGSGRTPFARGGDGKAAVGPMLREVLIGEAMHALGIPSTRALAVVATGEDVMREVPFPGAVLTRVAASHLRVGTFQYFAARGETDQVRRLADYTIARHDPALAGRPGRYLELLQSVAARQAALIARWMNVGFIHGVMNTDNMAISGETIDYGPCAFLEAYDPATVFSSIDHHGRYAYGNQPAIANWNLARLAETLLPLIDEDPQQAIAQATAVIDAFPALYAQALLQGQRAKLGLGSEEADDEALAVEFLRLLQEHGVDFTLGWRHLAAAAEDDEVPLRALFAETQAPGAWLVRWRARCARDDARASSAGSTGEAASVARAARLRATNPLFIPRNHLVEEALAAASADDELGPFERLLAVLREPFADAAGDPDRLRFTQPAPAELTAGYQTFCGT